VRSKLQKKSLRRDEQSLTTVAGKAREKKKNEKMTATSCAHDSSFREATAKEQRCNRVLPSPQDPPKDKKKLFGDGVACPCCALQCQCNCRPSCHTCVRGCAIMSSTELLDKVLVSVTHASATRLRGLQINVSRIAAYCQKR